MQSVNRDNLGDAVAQFLARGGEIEHCEEEKKVTRKPRRSRQPRASGYAETNPYDVPLSLAERQHLAPVRDCAERGLSLVQATKETSLPRSTILRLCKEFNFSLRGATPESPAQVAQALREQYLKGVPHQVACNRLHLDAETAALQYRENQHLLADVPTPPVMHEGSDAHVLSLIVLGMSEGLTLAQVIKENNLDSARAYRVYDHSRRRTRRLL